MILGPASRMWLLAQVPDAAHAAMALVLVGCLVAVLHARTRLGPRRRPPRDQVGSGTDGGEVARVLQARGLARGEALRGMSPRERQFLLEHAAPALGPRAVLRTPGAGPAIVRSRPTPTSRTPTPALTLTAPPKRVHCPACGGAFSGAVSAPVVAPCPRCGRRVSAHVEGARLVVTVEDDSGRPRRKH